jgi:pimeloyl-ACP methyl ester carboxylesterase
MRQRSLTAKLAVVASLAGIPQIVEGQAQRSVSPADWAQTAHLRIDRLEVATSRGFNARLVVSRPDNGTRQLSAVVFIPWLSCDPVEVADSTDDGYIRFTRDLAARSRAVVIRVEKPGVDGSPGPDCATSTLGDDFSAFHAGLDAAFSRTDVDTSNIFVVGGSIGGAFAVILAAESRHHLAGVVSVNSFGRTWFEHMIELERRRLTLSDSPANVLGRTMRGFETFYDAFLNRGLTPGQVLTEHPELRAIWYDSTRGQYGRSAEYFQAVQALDVDGALAALTSPALFVSSQFDWVMGAHEAEFALMTSRRSHPGLATARVYPGLSHGLHFYTSALRAFQGRQGVYEPRVAADVAAWMTAVRWSGRAAGVGSSKTTTW